MFKGKRLGCQVSKENGPGNNERQGFVRGNAWGVARGDEPLTLTRCHRYMKPSKGGSPFVAEPTT